jgi:hypothetical protein
VDKDRLRRLLPEQDVFLWEGHYKTLIDDYGFVTWDEPLVPSLFFLQSCLALNPKEVRPLYERGAVAVVGSSTRIYSGTGGAFSLAFFDGFLYDGQTLGGALRQAKNFLLAYAELKERRLGDAAPLAGANRRSAWAFTLWGDPTLRLPRPTSPKGALPFVRCRLVGNTLTLPLPGRLPEVRTEAYRAEAPPNARLAGLVRTPREQKVKRLVPMLFAEVVFPADRTGRPRLQGRLPRERWVFRWDARLRRGYLLVLPRDKDVGEVRFRVEWEG